MIELAERPADTAPPSLTAGWYDPDSSAFEPLVVAAPTTDEVAAAREPAGTGHPASAAGVAFEAR